jgi:hypothetical protein
MTDVDTDTSVAAKQCRLHYDDARKWLLEESVWRFATARQTRSFVHTLIDANDRWTLSPTIANTYYLKNTSQYYTGVEPTTVYEDDEEMTYASALAGLAAGSWGFGDNDTLGYDTLYVHLSDSTDPDSKFVEDTDEDYLECDYGEPDFEYLYRFAIPYQMIRAIEINKTETTETNFVREEYHLLCNDDEIELKYIKDNTSITNWPQYFKDAVMAELAIRVAAALTESRNLVGDIVSYRDRVLASAQRHGAIESKPEKKETQWVDAR